MQWGFPQYQKKGLLINARAETALERKSFRDSVLHRRCVIPARHFYEWDSDKNKVTFFRKDAAVVYMAGFYNRFGDEERFYHPHDTGQCLRVPCSPQDAAGSGDRGAKGMGI